MQVAQVKQIARHAIVTGGSSGIGKATAMLLARRGTHVTLMARRPEVLAAAKQEVEAVRVSPQQVVTDLSVDVSDRVAVEAAVAQAAERSGPCDLLVTSAGIAHPGYFEEVQIEVFERTMAVNYFGTLYTVRAVVPEMMRAGGGNIVMVSSGAGIVGLFGYTPYSPTKFALRGLAESLRPELARHKITVSIAYPPDTDTPQLAEEMKTKPPETQAITAARSASTPARGGALVLLAPVGELCRKLDGLSVAVELARATLLPPAALLEQPALSVLTGDCCSSAMAGCRVGCWRLRLIRHAIADGG